MTRVHTIYNATALLTVFYATASPFCNFALAYRYRIYPCQEGYKTRYVPGEGLVE